MNVDARLQEMIEIQRQTLQHKMDIEDALLKHGGGGGTSGGMEARVARLESDMEHSKKALDRLDAGLADVKKTVGDIKVTVGVLDERTKHLPGKGFIFTTAAAMLAAGGGLTALIVRFLPAAG